MDKPTPTRISGDVVQALMRRADWENWRFDVSPDPDAPPSADCILVSLPDARGGEPNNVRLALALPRMAQTILELEVEKAEAERRYAGLRAYLIRSIAPDLGGLVEAVTLVEGCPEADMDVIRAWVSALRRRAQSSSPSLSGLARDVSAKDRVFRIPTMPPPPPAPMQRTPIHHLPSRIGVRCGARGALHLALRAEDVTCKTCLRLVRGHA